MKKFLFLFLTLGFFVSCLETIENDVLVEKVDVTPETRNLRVGDRYELAVAITPGNATNKTVVWSSSEPSVVSVDDAGRITAHALSSGSVTITARSANGLSDNCRITVVATPVTGITVAGAPTNYDDFRVGENSFRLTASVTPSDATDKTVTWTSSPIGYLDITANSSGSEATVKAVKATPTGTSVTIVAVAGDQRAEVRGITVAPTPVTGIEISPTIVWGARSNGAPPVDLWVGDTFTLSARVLPTTATEQGVIWTSSDPSIATIGEGTGTVTILNDGQVYFTARSVGDDSIYTRTTDAEYADYEWPGDGEFYVPVALATSVTIEREGGEAIPTTMQKGDRIVLTATATTDSGAPTTDEWVWASSDRSVIKETKDPDDPRRVTIEALKDGADIVITLTCGAATDAKTIDVETPVESIVINEGDRLITNNKAIVVGTTFQFTITVVPAGATGDAVWSLPTGNNVATISQNGLLTAETTGACRIKVEYGGKSDEVTIDVIPAP